MWNHRGSLFVVSAPSGAGKTTLCQRLASEIENIRHSVSYTTRKPRKGEINDRDYTFTDRDTFMRMAEADDFIEWAEVHGNLYGTSKNRIEDMLVSGMDVMLDIDTQGAAQMRKLREAVYIFIMPPSMKVLRQRIDTRMSNSPDDIDMRLRRATDEIREYKNYDYVIVNDRFEDALAGLKAIVTAERLRTARINPQWVKNFGI